MDLTSSVGNKLVPGDELGYDRAKEVKEFDETKAGVKRTSGLWSDQGPKVPHSSTREPSKSNAISSHYPIQSSSDRSRRLNLNKVAGVWR